jgi:hypothetical protein
VTLNKFSGPRQGVIIRNHGFHGENQEQEHRL